MTSTTVKINCMNLKPTGLDGAIPSTPSRWHTQFCLALGSLAFGGSRLKRCAIDDVTISLVKALEAMGAGFKISGDVCMVEGGLFHPRGDIDAAGNEDNLAILAGVAANLPRTSRISFESRIKDSYSFINALMALGVGISSQAHGRDSPWLIRGPTRHGGTHITGEVPPAYVCSLTLACLLRMRHCDILISGLDHSRAMMAITEDALTGFGVGVTTGLGNVRVSGSEPLRPSTIRIMNDSELAAYPLAAGALCGRATVSGDMADEAVTSVMRALNTDVSTTRNKITVNASELNGATIDLSRCPRSFPAIAVMATAAKGGTVLHSAKIPGRDIITPTVKMLRRMGCLARVTEDGAVIPHSDLKGIDHGHYEDPLVAMAAVVAACKATGDSEIGNPEICEYEYPGFLRHMSLLGLAMDDW